MEKTVFKLGSFLLIAVMMVGVLVACGSAKAQKGNVKYTLRYVWSAGPLNWNPHAWENNSERLFMDYITTPFVYSTLDKEAGEGHWKWAYSAATALTDITKDFADKEKFGITTNVSKNRVYEIKLNPAMKWQNGDPIKAQDYIESMQMCLDPEMKNYRSNSYCTGEYAIYNAVGYFNNDKAGKTIYKQYNEKETPVDAKLFFTLTDNIVFFGESAKNFYKKEQHKRKFIVEGVDLFKKYEGKSYFAVTDESKADMLVIAKAFGDTNPEAWKEFVVYDTGEVYKETPWDAVGLFATDDYTLVYVTAKPVQEFYMHWSLTDSWLVHQKTYQDNFKTVEQLKATSYGTSMETTVSCGPYQIESYEKDKQIRMVRNPHWCGYSDGMHQDQFVADAVVLDIIENHATTMQRFGQGLVDVATLNSQDLERYKKSDRVYYAPETYTARYIFATDEDSLKTRDSEKGSGRRIVLHYRDFRKALSLCIDRQKYCTEATPGFKPAYYLFNSLYYYNIVEDPNSIYRNSKYAKMAVLDLYDIPYSEATIDAEYDKVTGRDIQTARTLFNAAYKQAVKDGNYNDGEMIPIEIMVSREDLTSQHVKQKDLMQDFFNEGTKGTPFEGKIQVVFEHGDPRRYENVAAGKNMAIHGAWGGAAFNPFNSIRLYVDPEYMNGLDKINESNGWNPTLEDLTIKLKKADGTIVTETKTLDKWSHAIIGDGKYAKNIEEKLQIFAALENAVLESYQCIPLGTYTKALLASYKVSFQTDIYHIMYGFGDDARHLQFNYTDAEWEKYLSEHGGTLNYE